MVENCTRRFPHIFNCAFPLYQLEHVVNPLLSPLHPCPLHLHCLVRLSAQMPYTLRYRVSLLSSISGLDPESLSIALYPEMQGYATPDVRVANNLPLSR